MGLTLETMMHNPEGLYEILFLAFLFFLFAVPGRLQRAQFLRPSLNGPASTVSSRTGVKP